MAFPDDVLTADERVVLHLRPHWKAAVRPVLVLLATLAALVVVLVYLPGDDDGRTGVLVVAAACLVVAVWKVLWPLLVWRGTHYVFTDERVLLQRGVLARDRRDIPLARVNDHAMSQRVVERLLGCGTLTIDSAGELAPAVLEAVPGVARVQTTLYELVEADRDRHPVDDGTDDASDVVGQPDARTGEGRRDARPRRFLGRSGGTPDAGRFS